MKRISLLPVIIFLMFSNILFAQEYNYSRGTTADTFRVSNEHWMDFYVKTDSLLHVKHYLWGERAYPDTNWVKKRITVGSSTTRYATNIKGAYSNRILYQKQTDSTGFLPAPQTNKTIRWTGSAYVFGNADSTITSGTANQMFGMNNGATAKEWKSILGTTNRVTVTHAANSITLSGPQDIATTSSPTFSGLTAINGNSNTQSIYPLLTDTYDLGSETKLWRKGWLSEMEAVLFAKNTITLLGGWFYVTKDAGTLPVDVNNSQTTIDFGKAMTPNDFIVFRQPLTVEYMQIGSLYSGTTYYVTRNLDGSGANTWAGGTPYAVFGQSGNGRIELNAYDTPRLSIIKQGAAYNSQTELIRAGDLNGFLGYSSETYGIAIGEATKYLKYDVTNGLRIAGDITMSNGSITWANVNAPTQSNLGTWTTYINSSGIYTGTLTANQVNAVGIVADTIKATTVGNIAGWDISTNRIYKSFSGGGGAVSIANVSNAAYTSSAYGKGLSVSIDKGNKSAAIFVGEVPLSAIEGDYSFGVDASSTSRYGIWFGNQVCDTIPYFEMSIKNADGAGANFIKAKIAGWSFDQSKFYKGSATAGFALNTSSTPFITGNNSKGFEVYDVSNPKMFLGLRDGSGVLSTGLDWNVTTANKLTIKGDVISSRFTTSTTFAETDTYTGTMINSNGVFGRKLGTVGYTYWAFDLTGERLWFIEEDISRVATGLGITVAANHIVRTIHIDGYNVPKCYGVRASAPTSGMHEGDSFFEIGTGVYYVYTGTAWQGHIPDY